MPGSLFLEGEKIELRTVEKEDVEFLREGANMPEVRTHLTLRKPHNLNQQEEFFEEVISSEQDVHLAICSNEEIAGIISLEEVESEIRVAEIGIWLHPDHHQKGYGTEAAQLITKYGFKELNYHKIIARAHENNKGSNKIWEKLGFQEEGHLREYTYREGEFQDVKIYSILENEWRQK